MRNIIKTFSNKCLSLSYLSDNWNNNLIQSIVEAGRTISYVETLNPSKTDKFHLSIKESDKRLFMREFEKIVKFAITKLKLKRVKIAFDTTEDLTWIKENHHLRPSVYEHKLLCWNYLNVSIVEPYFIPLMSVPYTMFNNLDNLVTDLLNYMESKNFPYLMLIPKKGKIKDFANKTQSLNYFEHSIKYNKESSVWKARTTIIARRVDDKTCWCYITNQNPSLLLVKEYSKRWNIETGFRIHDEARIKSKSKNNLIRFFYHLIGMLLVILWRLQNRVNYYVFKRYLKFLEYQFYPEKIKRLINPP